MQHRTPRAVGIEKGYSLHFHEVIDT